MSNPQPGPILLPQNRRLRHLKGIYLRNLSFARPRGRATDDATLNTSAAKLETLKESAQLAHARSTESLVGLVARPGQGRKRSGTTAYLGALERQRGLQASVEARVADGFFSVHVDGDGEPVYISEVVERSSNFNFQFFDLTHLHPGITRASELTVKVWTRRQAAWTLLIEDTIELRSLSFLPTLENQHLPPNGLVFHLTDGMYTADVAPRSRRPKAGPAVPTSSYNALMKLATLDNSIQDALATQDVITMQINEILEWTPQDETPEARDKVALARRYVSIEQRALGASEARREEMKESLTARRDAIREGRALQEKAARDVANAQEKLASSKESVGHTKEQIRGQRRRICSDIATIFDISPIPDGAPLSFRICGLALPNTSYDAATSRATNEDVLSAALGHVAVLTNMLQYYLSTPLPYPITPLGSRSSIRDDISLLTDLNPQSQARSRDFPLYLPRGGSTAAHFRFEYAWFLLNKDIEALCASQGLRIVDIRHTLPNLKYLLYVCSAGTDQVPERKRGGVRGLWAGRMKGRATAGAGAGAGAGAAPFGGDDASLGSRRASVDSTVVESEVGSPLAGPGLPFGEGQTKLTLRTKGLRENVSR